MERIGWIMTATPPRHPYEMSITMSAELPAQDQIRVAIIGLGYVGLPLAVAFGKHLPTIGYDIDQTRIDELNAGSDHTLEVSSNELHAEQQFRFRHDPTNITSVKRSRGKDWER